jgi:hypothetical protein
MATYTLTTDCTCESYDDNDNLTPSDECFGCYDDDKALLIETLDKWIAELELSHIEVQGRKMGWTRANGSVIIDADAEELIKAMQLRGDFRLEFDLPDEDYDHDLKVMRYSHDEPTGATFLIDGLTTCPDSDCSGECNSNFCENFPD